MSYQNITKINISNNILFEDKNEQIDTTGRLNEKLYSKFNKSDIIKKDETQTIINDDKVYSAAKIDDKINNIEFNNINLKTTKINNEIINYKIYTNEIELNFNIIFKNLLNNQPDLNCNFTLNYNGMIYEYYENNNIFISLTIPNFHINLSDMYLYNNNDDNNIVLVGVNNADLTIRKNNNENNIDASYYDLSNTSLYLLNININNENYKFIDNKISTPLLHSYFSFDSNGTYYSEILILKNIFENNITSKLQFYSPNNNGNLLFHNINGAVLHTFNFNNIVFIKDI